MCRFFKKRGRVLPIVVEEYSDVTVTTDTNSIKVASPRRNSLYMGTPPVSAQSLIRTPEGSLTYSGKYRPGDIYLLHPSNRRVVHFASDS
jgi:hypothetical protein